MKRTVKEVGMEILKILKDGKEHSYGDLERKVNTNWQSIRNHCENLEFFEIITISSLNRIKITDRGRELLKKIK